MKLILASASPRRKALLKEYGFDFTVKVSPYDETPLNLPPKQTVMEYAKGKAESVFNGLDGDFVVLGADTIVVYDGVILGKPVDKQDAVKTLKKLSDKTHKVLTGYAIVSKKGTICNYVETSVKFNDLTPKLIEDYVNTGLPLDKAGSYGIQDGYDLVKEIDGSFNNVVGLPIEIIKEKLDELLK
ncbi:MAG: septum formation protein Maf [Clostridiales bacterium]|nr:septum formation protein Maf [Clostridiales bacterium]